MRPRVPATARAARGIRRRLVEGERAWIAVAITYTGLVALGVPEQSLQSFPEAFRVGMAARADMLLDHGENDPKHWDRRSAADWSTSPSASSATPRKSGAAPWRWRGSSTRDSLALPCWPRRTSAPSPAISIRSATRTDRPARN